jgi:hypothetical protein
MVFRRERVIPTELRSNLAARDLVELIYGAVRAIPTEIRLDPATAYAREWMERCVARPCGGIATPRMKNDARMLRYRRTAPVAADGSYEFPNVPAGLYFLSYVAGFEEMMLCGNEWCPDSRVVAVYMVARVEPGRQLDMSDHVLLDIEMANTPHPSTRQPTRVVDPAHFDLGNLTPMGGEPGPAWEPVCKGASWCEWRAWYSATPQPCRCAKVYKLL